MNKWKNFSTLTLASKMMISTAIPLLLIAILGFVSFSAVKTLEEDNKWVIHTYNVLGELAKIEKLMIEVESTERGFLVSGKNHFLESYYQSVSELVRTAKKLKVTVSDNPLQVERATMMEELQRQWIEETSNVAIETRKQVVEGSKDLEYLQSEVSKERGKKILDEIRNKLDGLSEAFARSNNQKAKTLVIAIEKNMVDQETGERGYLITGKENFLEPYHQGLKELKENINRLYNIVDNSYNIDIMKRDITTLERLDKKWQTTIAENRIKLKRKAKGNKQLQKEVITLTKAAEGKNIVDEMRKILLRMEKSFIKANSSEGESLLLLASKSLVEKETGLRGFIITGDDKFLEPYNNGQMRFQESVTALKRLIKNSYNPHQVRRMISEVASLSEQWATTVAKHEIEARQEVNKTVVSMADVRKMLESANSDNLVEQIKKIANEFKSEELKLMEARRAAVKDDVETSNLIIALGTLVVITLSIIISRFIVRMIDTQLQETAKIAEAISEGDLDVNIVLQNDKDYLGSALQKMTGSLRKNTKDLVNEKKKLESEDWIKGTQAQIFDKLQQVNNINEFSTTLINELSKALEAQLGILYFRKEEGQEPYFCLLSSYAYKKRKGATNKFKVGEGLVGQCALEKKTMIITNPPEDYIQIQSGCGTAVPKSIIIVPIMIKDKVAIIIEIAKLDEMSKAQDAMIESITSSLGVMLSNLLSKSETENLLASSQALSEQLREQQAELQSTNEELSSQTDALRKSEDKLRTQSEELQVINEELEEKTERLEKQKNELNLAKEDLEQRAKDLALSSKYKSEFLANMSHELRTPLNSLLILSKKLAVNKERNLTDKQVKSAEIINKGGHELLSLINDILDLSKVEAGKLQLEITSCPLKKICTDLQNQFEAIATEKGLHFDVEIQKNIPEIIFTDELRIIQVLRNFMSNAFKFTEKGGVRLQVNFPKRTMFPKNFKGDLDNYLQFSVVDTGIGISKEKQRIIFESFQQAEGSTSRKFGGTGLGLAISKAMAEMLGGKIEVTSEEERGSTFSLILPIKENDGVHTFEVEKKMSSEDSNGQRVMPRTTLNEKETSSSVSYGTPTVLIVEDDKHFSELISKFASEYGYRVIQTENGKDAIELASKENPDAIILDLGLPDMDGVEVLEKLKQDLETCQIPVHVISAREEEKGIKEQGAIGYLIKPATEKSLSQVFKTLRGLNITEIKKVLVVEDSLANQRAIKELLEDQNIEIHNVESGKKAISFLKGNKVDCIILDLNLPDISGFEVLENIDKTLEESPPVIIYTGKELTQEEHQRLQKYSSSIVLKGVNSPERLIDEVTLFLHSIEEKKAVASQKLIRMMHSGNESLINKKILLVDDDMRNVFALSNELEDYSLDVIIASNGEQAIAKLDAEGDVDMVLMDIMMPVMDGYTAIEKIRKNNAYKKLPIIALTAKAMAGDRDKCIHAGANDYISKPIDVDQLISMIKVWLSK